MYAVDEHFLNHKWKTKLSTTLWFYALNFNSLLNFFWFYKQFLSNIVSIWIILIKFGMQSIWYELFYGRSAVIETIERRYRCNENIISLSCIITTFRFPFLWFPCYSISDILRCQATLHSYPKRQGIQTVTCTCITSGLSTLLPYIAILGSYHCP